MDRILEVFREKLKNGGFVIGPFMKTGDPAFVEIAGHAGFDYVILDMEHGPVSYEQMQNNIRGAVLSGIVPVIRVQELDEAYISKALDIGALGVQIPQVKNSSQARDAVKAAKFHPDGGRGVCRFVRAADYSCMDRYDYFRHANENLVILQLEGEEAIADIDGILEVKGIDIIFIGPYDLSQSLGIPGQTDSPLVMDRMRYIIEKSRSRNIIVGTFVDRPEDIRKWRDAGVQYISYSVDVGIFSDACIKLIKFAKGF